MPKATIYYYDIGDYLTREEKLAKVKTFGSVNGIADWRVLQPNEHGDWINERNDAFESFIPLEPEKKYELKSNSFFVNYSLGTATARDTWVYNFSKRNLSQNIDNFLSFYNKQRLEFRSRLDSSNKFDDVVTYDPTKISWNDALKTLCSNNIELTNNIGHYRVCAYRPFNKLNLYFDKCLIQRPYQIPKLFPTQQHSNLVICVSGVGASKDFSVLISDVIPDLQVQFNGQCFPLYYYEKTEKEGTTLFDAEQKEEYVRRDGVSDFILDRVRKQYGLSSRSGVSKEDIFYYVYGFLHSPDYRRTFANDLKKMLPRLPLVEDIKDFWAFSKAGRALAELHLNYETFPAPEGVVIHGAEHGNFMVEKMRFPKKGEKHTIYYNHAITISNIPAEAYEYVVNGKSAIEWVMERYQITTHKESGITNNPNDWSSEVGNPRYILDVLLGVIGISIKSVEIVKSLPKVEFEEGEEK